MKTSIATVSISGDFEEKLIAIARAGFDGIEIFENVSWPSTVHRPKSGAWFVITGWR